MHQTKSGLKEVVSQSVLADAKSTNEIGRKRGDISSINFVKTLILLGELKDGNSKNI